MKPILGYLVSFFFQLLLSKYDYPVNISLRGSKDIMQMAVQCLLKTKHLKFYF
jgi:hypothetical protein